MRKLICLLTLTTTIWASDTLIVMRSEFEKAGDKIDTLLVGAKAGKPLTGPDAHYFSYVPSNGVLKIADTIADIKGEVTESNFDITDTNGELIHVKVVDGFDYILAQNSDKKIITEHQTGELPDTNGNWAAYNNLWGANKNGVSTDDYRIAMIVDDSLPNGGWIVWDVPGKSTNYGSASVWNYSNFLFGARANQRDSLGDFPYLLDSIEEFTVDFDYDEVVGDDQFKVALNMFFTDTNAIAPLSMNSGDFFFVLDQKGTWIPGYDVVVVDDTLMWGEHFQLLYDNNNGYERRRVIVKDNGRVKSGTIDMNYFFNRFASEGMMNMQQYFPNFQFGVEVTDGFGAIHINHLSATIKKKGGATSITKSLIEPTTSSISVKNRHISIANNDNFSTLAIYSLRGQLVYRKDISGQKNIDLNKGLFSSGSYIFKLVGTRSVSQKVVIE